MRNYTNSYSTKIYLKITNNTYIIYLTLQNNVVVVCLKRKKKTTKKQHNQLYKTHNETTLKHTDFIQSIQFNMRQLPFCF